MPYESDRARPEAAHHIILEDRERLSGLFADMRCLFERVRDEGIDGVEMRELSMGMSGDYDLAAAHGATLVRIGSALLGPRG